VFTRPLLYHNQLLQLRLLLLLPVALVVANKVAFSVINTGILRRYLYRSRNLPYLEVHYFNRLRVFSHSQDHLVYFGVIHLRLFAAEQVSIMKLKLH
jgi:hypothetical protein